MAADRRGSFIFPYVLALVLALVAIPVRAQADDDFDRIIKDKVVRIGAVESFPNYKKDLKSGQWVGIIPDISELIFSSIGVKVEYVPTDWGSAAAGLQSGRFDIIGAYGATPQRALAVDFTKPVTDIQIGLLTLNEPAEAYSHWATLNKPQFRIAAIEGGATTIAARRLIPDVTWSLVKGYDAMVMELESGRVDAIVSSEPILQLYRQAKGKGTIVMPKDPIATPSNFAVRKGSTQLKEWLNIAIDYYRADGEFKLIWDKYLYPEAK
ncbi:transporter substrate-binding domain-containing protein [Sodalis sp. RH21]|uniref:transporter substrate-binding domain-containing protein n=1 Tax=unclassified Sodalis (in: enterobacteria) TaxID=2636512 RepID=UPI0039B4D8FD